MWLASSSRSKLSHASSQGQERSSRPIRHALTCTSEPIHEGRLIRLTCLWMASRRHNPKSARQDTGLVWKGYHQRGFSVTMTSKRDGLVIMSMAAEFTNWCSKVTSGKLYYLISYSSPKLEVANILLINVGDFLIVLTSKPSNTLLLQPSSRWYPMLGFLLRYALQSKSRWWAREPLAKSATMNAPFQSWERCLRAS